jgi:PHD/YefM family antitoxin component YafN of YafNO toxin-antitoxin module
MSEGTRNIGSPTKFERDPASLLRQLWETGQPIVLTINGKAELVVQDAKSYQKLLELTERLETIAAVKEGLQSMERGEDRPMEEVFADLERELWATPKR